jgi:hypothetical protein
VVVAGTTHEDVVPGASVDAVVAETTEVVVARWTPYRVSFQ